MRVLARGSLFIVQYLINGLIFNHYYINLLYFYFRGFAQLRTEKFPSTRLVGIKSSKTGKNKF